MTGPASWSEGGEGPAERDRGLLFGEGLFETVLVRAGRPFRWRDHLARLRASAQTLGLPLPAAGWEERLAAALHERAAVLPLARARVTLTAGPVSESGDPGEEPRGPARLLLHVHSLATAAAGPPALTACPAGPHLPGGAEALSAHKTLAWLGPLLSLRQARAAGADEGLMTTRAGLLVGGSRGNLFVVRDGVLLTPSLASGCLPGIARRIILEELCPALEIPCREDDLFCPEAFSSAQEAFLSNSLRGVTPLAGALPGALFRAAPGPLTTRIQKAYDALVASPEGTE